MGRLLLIFVLLTFNFYLLSLNLSLVSSHPNYYTDLKKKKGQDNNILTQLFHIVNHRQKQLRGTFLVFKGKKKVQYSTQYV